MKRYIITNFRILKIYNNVNLYKEEQEFFLWVLSKRNDEAISMFGYLISHPSRYLKS